jgi:hypothetical protein
LVQVLYALTFYVKFQSETVDLARSIIYQVTYAYAYISVLILTRRILASDKVLIHNILWIIRLECIKAVSHVMLTLGIYYAAIFVYVSSLVLAVFYILSMIRIFNGRNAGRAEITKLGPILISLVICFILATMGGLYAAYDRISLFTGVTNLIMVIPFIFLILYLKNLKNKQLNLGL